MDGKTLCGASAHGENTHLVSLVRHESGTVLTQVKVKEKHDEREAVSRRLLDYQELAGTVTTFDALHTQVRTAEQVLRRNGRYLMEVKKNQPVLSGTSKNMSTKTNSTGVWKCINSKALMHSIRNSTGRTNVVLSILHHEGWHYLPDVFRFSATNLQKTLRILKANTT